MRRARKQEKLSANASTGVYLSTCLGIRISKQDHYYPGFNTCSIAMLVQFWVTRHALLMHCRTYAAYHLLLLLYY